MIIDPYLPDLDILFLMNKLHDRIQILPVVLHTFLSYYYDYSGLLRLFPFVEKQGNSIEHLKEVVFGVLQKHYSKQIQDCKGIPKSVFSSIKHTISMIILFIELYRYLYQSSAIPYL